MAQFAAKSNQIATRFWPFIDNMGKGTTRVQIPPGDGQLSRPLLKMAAMQGKIRQHPRSTGREDALMA